MPFDTDTCTLVYSKPLMASSSLASACMPYLISVLKVASVTPQPLMVYARSDLDLGVDFSWLWPGM
eukprot:338261-Prorocentrum_lima.AAC.1